MASLTVAGLCAHGASAEVLHPAVGCGIQPYRPLAAPVRSVQRSNSLARSAQSSRRHSVAFTSGGGGSTSRAGRRGLRAPRVVDDTTSPSDYDRELEGTDPGVTAIVKVEGDDEAEKSDAEKVGDEIRSIGDAAENISGLSELKLQLIDSLYGTDRGLTASSETRGEVLELIAKLEAQNPNGTPTDLESRHLLNGKWVLAYTSYSEVYPLLAAGSLPLVRVGEISQTIDTTFSKFVNSITFTGPVAATTFSASASFQVRSPSRLQIKFEEAVLSPPAVVGDPQTPDALYLFGQRVPLDAFRPVLDALQGVAVQLTKALSGQPPLRLSIGDRGAESWLLTTFLDEDLRIARGDGGGIFVLTKAGSSLAAFY